MRKQPNDQEHSLWFRGLADLRITFHSFSAHCRAVGKDWVYPQHVHPMFEFNLVLEGKQFIWYNGEELLMGPGDLLLVKPGDKHSSRAYGSSDMVYGCIHFELDEPLMRQFLYGIKDALHPNGSPLACAVGPVLRRLREVDASSAFGQENRLEMMGICYSLLGELSKLLKDPPPGLVGAEQGTKGLPARMAERIEKAVTEQPGMNDEEFGRLGIARIAEELGYSPAYCNRVFKSVFGISPRHYLSTMKLRQAKQLLMNRDMSIERIADKLGYRDVSQFSKQFKRWTNISPSQYRQLTDG
jgi:AraC-like DNA-binding protein/mannose-6-phosphate isomerase-like protein (cupin superfamily)